MKKVLLLLLVIFVNNIYAQSEKYKPGFYTDSSGNKISGLINYISGKQIKFRSNNEEEPIKLKSNEILGFTRDGVEYTILKNFKIKLQLLMESRDSRFVKQIKGLLINKRYVLI